MKSKLFILFFLCSASMLSQVCEPNEISTDPDNPINGVAPDSKFKNAFNWFQQTVGGQLMNIPIYDLNSFYSITEMLNPYHEDNELCYYLDKANIEDLDIYPEDGWELLFINLGYYPDLTLLDDVSESSETPNAPYIVLYNKYRSIVRVFANIRFAQTNYDEVEVILGFNDEDGLNSSGLFRYGAGVDRTLDKQTGTTSMTSYAKLPDEPKGWFHVDFQVAYDPCTCLYDSRLQLVLRPVDSDKIKISQSDFSAVELYLQGTDSRLDQENAIIPVAPRMITFHTLAENMEYTRVLNEQYMQRAETEGYNMDWYKIEYSLPALIATIAHSGGNVIGTAQINNAAQHAAAMRHQWGLIAPSGYTAVINRFTDDVERVWGILPSDSWYVQGNNHIINLEKFGKFCQANLPKSVSFSSLASMTDSEASQWDDLPSSSYLNTEVDLATNPQGNPTITNLLNPGTYPVQENTSGFGGVKQQNYPVYNEVLVRISRLHHVPV